MGQGVITEMLLGERRTEPVGRGPGGLLGGGGNLG